MAGLGRREALLGLGLLGLGTAWQIWGVREPGLSFRAIPGAPGWEFGQAGAVSRLSGTDLITVGLDASPDPLAPQRLASIVHRHRGADVPVAVFNDFFCPYCRALLPRLERLPGISVTWHELPLLGEGSRLVAQAAQAAALQDGYLAFYRQLITDGFRPSARWMAQVAERAGLDGEALALDMPSPRVAAGLLDSAAAAALLGFYATPGLVIGQKAILGALTQDHLNQLVEETARV